MTKKLLAIGVTIASCIVYACAAQKGFVPAMFWKLIDPQTMKLRATALESGLTYIDAATIAAATLGLLTALPYLITQLLDSSKDLPQAASRTNATQPSHCNCRACLRDQRDENGFPKLLSTFVVCSQCGNKRCPKAQNHQNLCTNSNAPNQPHLHT